MKKTYANELYKGFNTLMSFSFCFTTVSVISCLSGLFITAIKTGGPVVLFWSWIVSSIFSISVGAVMAEICSTYPSAGSVYYWAGIMAPEKYSDVIAYFTGWFNFMGKI